MAPALPYGSSGEHAGFPGTLSIGQEALEHAVVELVRSADAFAAVVLVVRARRQRRAAGPRPPAPAGRGPAASHLVPARARRRARRADRDLADARLGPRPRPGRRPPRPATSAPITELLPALRAGGVQAVAPNGVLGDPAGASAAEGEAVLGALVDDLLATIDQVGARV